LFHSFHFKNAFSRLCFCGVKKELCSLDQIFRFSNHGKMSAFARQDQIGAKILLHRFHSNFVATVNPVKPFSLKRKTENKEKTNRGSPKKPLIGQCLTQ